MPNVNGVPYCFSTNTSLKAKEKVMMTRAKHDSTMLYKYVILQLESSLAQLAG